MQDSLIHCPQGHKYGVVDSRTLLMGGLETMRRKRKCPTCGHKLVTIELPEIVAKEVLQEDDA